MLHKVLVPLCVHPNGYALWFDGLGRNFLSPWYLGLYLWGSDHLPGMDHILHPTCSWVSGSAHPADPVCEAVAMVTSDLSCSWVWKNAKMVQGLKGLHPTPQTAHPLQNSLVSMMLRLPRSDVDLMVWPGTPYSLGYGEVMFKMNYSFLRKALRKLLNKTLQKQTLLTLNRLPLTWPEISQAVITCGLLSKWIKSAKRPRGLWKLEGITPERDASQ